MDSGFGWESPSARPVLDAVISILTERGYEGLTGDRVTMRATTAGREPGELPDADALVRAALHDVQLLTPPAPTGSLRGDLLAMLRPWRSPRTREEIAVAAVLSAAQWRPQLEEAVGKAVDRSIARAVGTVLHRALPADGVPDRLLTLSWVLRGLALERLRSGARSAVDLDHLVDFLLAGLGGPRS
jgi:hypothetical protein